MAGKMLTNTNSYVYFRYLHLQDNKATDVNRTDKLWKIRWFLDFLGARFQALYQVNGFVTVDESMVKFKGRLGFRQYLPLKPVKWGVKVWVMAESSTDYCSTFQVYTGKDTAGTTEKGLAHRVVMDLTKPYYGSQLAVFMDNFYTGPELLTEMRKFGLYGCGTVRAGRKGLPKNPELTKKAKLERHAFRVAQKEELTFCLWQDTKMVMVLSNFHHPLARGKVNRRRERGMASVEVEVPASLSDYQRHMKGVDLMDQMIGYYQFQHRSLKWWRRVFFFFLITSCHNAFIAAKSVGGSDFKKTYTGFKEWLEDLTEELVGTAHSRAPPERTRTPGPSPSSSAAPSPVPMSGTPSPGPSSSTHSPGDASTASSPVSAPHHDFERLSEKRRSCKMCLAECSGTG